MKKMLHSSMIIFAGLILSMPAQAADDHGGPVVPKAYTSGATLTKSVQADITPDKALNILKQGNARYVAGKRINRNYPKQVKQTALGQFPFASVLGCIDSRVPPEIVFDTGVGDIFAARVAGNVVNEDILGSLEYASKVAGSRVIVVLGHTQCGAVKGACDGVQLGNITTLLNKIQPAVAGTKTDGERTSKNHHFVEDVAELNVDLAIKNLREQSSILRELENEGKIKIVGAIYDTSTGKVIHWR